MTDLQPEDTQDAPFYYTFKVQCTSCRETHPNFVSVSRFVCLSSRVIRGLALTKHLRSKMSNPAAEAKQTSYGNVKIARSARPDSAFRT